MIIIYYDWNTFESYRGFKVTIIFTIYGTLKRVSWLKKIINENFVISYVRQGAMDMGDGFSNKTKIQFVIRYWLGKARLRRLRWSRILFEFIHVFIAIIETGTRREKSLSRAAWPSYKKEHYGLKNYSSPKLCKT